VERRDIFVLNVRLRLLKGKLAIVELTGANPTGETNDMEKVTRISKNADPFIFRGKINGKFCDFKLDTGSDVTVINPLG